MLELVPDGPEKLTEDKVAEVFVEIDDILGRQGSSESSTKLGRLKLSPHSDPRYEEPVIDKGTPLLRLLSPTRYSVVARTSEARVGKFKIREEYGNGIPADRLPRLTIKDSQYFESTIRKGMHLPGGARLRKTILTLALGSMPEMEDPFREYGIEFIVLDAHDTEGHRSQISALSYLNGRGDLPLSVTAEFDPNHSQLRHNYETAELLLKGIKTAKEKAAPVSRRHR